MMLLPSISCKYEASSTKSSEQRVKFVQYQPKSYQNCVNDRPNNFHHFSVIVPQSAISVAFVLSTVVDSRICL